MDSKSVPGQDPRVQRTNLGTRGCIYQHDDDDNSIKHVTTENIKAMEDAMRKRVDVERETKSTEIRSQWKQFHSFTVNGMGWKVAGERIYG